MGREEGDWAIEFRKENEVSGLDGPMGVIWAVWSDEIEPFERVERGKFRKEDRGVKDDIERFKIGNFELFVVGVVGGDVHDCVSRWE